MALIITGVEVTQSTQIFGSSFPLCNGQPCPDNSVPLVADRQTILRVYVSGATPGNYVAAFMYVPNSETAPPGFPAIRVGTPIVARSQPPQRINASDTIQIDFLIKTPGTWRFGILVSEYDGQWNDVASSSQPFLLTLTFHERRRARIRLVRIHYLGRNLNIAAPTVQGFWNALDFAHRVLPVRMPGFDIVHQSEEIYDGDFTRIDPSAHDMNWAGYAGNNGKTGNLLNIMDRLVAAESRPSDVIYIGIYPSGARQSAFAGWSVSRWILGDLNPATLAHELAHSIGVPQHAPCGNPANIDPNFPTYGSFPSGSIGEVGFDPLLKVAFDPATTLDLMSYCPTRWISPYNYQKVFNGLPPLPPTAPEKPPLIEKIYVRLVKFPDRWIKVDLPPIPGPLPFPPPICSTPPCIVMRDRKGNELASIQARLEPASNESDKQQIGWLDAEIPVLSEAVSFDVIVDDETVFTEKIKGRYPSIKVKWPAASDFHKGSASLSWTARGKVEWFVVRTTNDGGENWIARILPGNQRLIELDSNLLQPGTNCMIEVLAVNGDRASRVVSQVFTVIQRPAPIMILSSTSVAVHTPQRPLRLTAISSSPDAHISWYSDRGVKLGEGAFMTVPPLPPGQYMIEARSDQPFETPTQLMVEVKTKPSRTAKSDRGK